MKLFAHSNKISTRELSLFFRQFYSLIAAGIPIINTCTMLEATQQRRQLYKLINSIKHDLLAGKSLSACLQRHPQHIDTLIHQLIQISEHTGKLDTTLQVITELLDKKVAFREELQRALFYPCVVALTGLIVTLIMLIFIVPRFAELFHDMPGAIPPLTQAIFSLSTIVRQSAWGLPLLLATPYLVIRSKKQYWLAHLPGIKQHLHHVMLARFTRNLGITLDAGIPISTALTLAAQPSNNPDFITTIRQLSRQVRAGVQLHRAMRSFELFTPLLIQMTKTGEESGQLESLLLKTADIMDADMERMLNRFSQLLEPLIMIILGVLIGGLVIGMYLPIFKLGNII